MAMTRATSADQELVIVPLRYGALDVGLARIRQGRAARAGQSIQVLPEVNVPRGTSDSDVPRGTYSKGSKV